MKRIFVIVALMLSASFIACQKQQTDEERQAEVERQVQERLAAEHQQEQAQQLDQREVDLNARQQALSEKEKQAAAARARAAATPERRTVRETTTRTRDLQPTGSYSMFYNRLEPYGDWIETRDYGYVYRPREATSNRWRPYTNGHWIYTDAGWTWISDEPFGWATYHYGRWTRIGGVGWVWVPGDEWAPAWVSWRKGGEYVGWAPLPPEARFDRRSGIRNWSDNYYDVGPDQYVFVETRRFGESRVERAIVAEQRTVTIVNQTTNVTNITYNNSTIINQGPSFDELQAQSQQPIQRLRIERQVNVQVNDPRTIVRGEAIEIPAPVIAPAQAAERPRVVKETIAQTTVDLGWAAISNQREADQARAKFRSEATPPPDAPSKKFVRASETRAAAASATATATPISTSRATETPAAMMRPTFTPRVAVSPISTPTPETTPSTNPSRTVSTPEPTISTTPRATATPTATVHRTFSPLPTSTPTPSESAPAARDSTPRVSAAERLPSVSPTASVSAAMTPFLNPREQKKEERRAEKETKQQLKAADDQRRRDEFEQIRSRAMQSASSPSATIAPSSTPLSTATPRPTFTPRPTPAEPLLTNESSPTATPPIHERQRNALRAEPSATPSASAVESNSPTESDAKNEKKKRKRDREAGKDTESESSPSASPSTAPEQ